MRNFDMQEIEWLEPWFARTEGDGLEAELKREVCCFTHPLYARTVKAVGSRVDNDDVLYFLPDHEFPFAVVHLTGKKEISPDWPWTVFYTSLADWVENCMKPDHLEYLEY
jgi:hypothetical protein